MKKAAANTEAHAADVGVEELVLEQLRREQLDQVLAIERTFAAPWTREMFMQELQQQWEVSDSIVALRDDRVVGYVLCWFVADEVHVVNLAVHPLSRRKGIAKFLMREVFERAARRGMVMATLEVRFNNDAAIRLYRRIGFRQVAIRKAYYADNGEDALVMIKDLTTSNSPPAAST